jgi:hypothetical protein
MQDNGKVSLVLEHRAMEMYRDVGAKIHRL